MSILKIEKGMIFMKLVNVKIIIQEVVFYTLKQYQEWRVSIGINLLN